MKRALVAIICCLPLIVPGRSVSQTPQSRVPSLQVTVESQDPQTGHYLVSVRNTSAHAVLHFCVGGAPNGSTAWNNVIKSGDAVHFTTANGFVVTAALFADGKYEGDPATAAQMADFYIGSLVQFERIQKQVDEIVAGREPDAVKLESISEALAKLPDQADAKMADRWLRDFPSLPPHEQQSGFMWQGMSDRKAFMLAEIRLLRKSPSGMPLVQWWAEFKQQTAKSVFLLDYQPS